MPGLKIPEQYERGIAVIKSLSDSNSDNILHVLNDASPQTSSAEIVKKLRPILPTSLLDGDIENLVEALYSLYFLRAHADVDVDKFVDDLADAISESDNKDIQTSNPEELVHLKGKFKSLLTVRPLSIQSKAYGLQRDFANIFWDATVISDIRPIWESEAKQPPGGTVITNTLKLEYHHTGGHGELYVYLDKDDIEKLMSVLKRAQDKMATLESLATASWMKILYE